jgi:hypothetical protein
LGKENNVHVPCRAVLYCHLLPDPFYSIFPYYLIKGTVLEFFIFSKTFSKSVQISDPNKIHPVGPEFFHADGPTDGQTRENK